MSISGYVFLACKMQIKYDQKKALGVVGQILVSTVLVPVVIAEI